jgi:4-hydroxymandelate oxidase
VSNHGGRQLDRALPTAHALSAVVDAVGDEAEVYVDGGVRSAADVLTALALGARAVFLGRPVLWALADDGRGGVRRLLEELATDLVEVLRLAGEVSPGSVPRDLVWPVRSL